MLAKLKIYAYGVLAILAVWFAWEFYINYNYVTESANGAAPVAKTVNSFWHKKPKQHHVVSTNAADTNAAAALTNALADTNAALVTNPAAGDTNLAAGNTNLPPGTNAAGDSNVLALSTNIPGANGVALGDRSADEIHHARSAMMTNLGLFVLAVIGLAVLFSYDFLTYFSNRSVDMLFDDDHGAGAKAPEYEHAEQVWADGHPMEAIQLMRDYLKKHPREQYVALRIAEIYEKDLRNNLAAALEIEEVLKHKLQPERWGWTAIHLCNLYTKLGREKEHFALLRRIVDEYPECSAAIKARKRLNPDADPNIIPTESASTAPPPPPEPEGKSKMPKGFRPK
jgi:TolA-binding protein